MSVLNQKMDEQMPYFKPGKEGKSREVAGCHTCTREKVCCDYGLWVLGPLPLRHCIRPLKCAPVCPKHKQGFHTQTPDSRLRLQGPSVYLLLTQKRPRGRIAVLLWLQFLLLLLFLSCSSSQKRDLECANCPEWLPPAHNSLSSSERSSRHCRNSSVCGSNTCRGQK